MPAASPAPLADYWFDGGSQNHDRRVWRWVLLGVFCFICVIAAFGLLCFACYRPVVAQRTIVTPVPMYDNRVYSSAGRGGLDVPPLPISPMPAYSGMATVRV